VQALKNGHRFAHARLPPRFHLNVGQAILDIV
jgi:hypothetical protein